MNMQDRITLSRWLASKASLAEVEQASCYGLVGNVRFTERARHLYRVLWTWSAPRFAGFAGMKQDRMYERMGKDALNRRMARCKRIIAALGA